MFSFRTTPIGEQLDKALRDGRVAVFRTPGCWDADGECYLEDIFRRRGNLALVCKPSEEELSPVENHIEFDLEALRDVAAVVVEIQDAGARYFNYTVDVLRLMSALSNLEQAPSLYIVDHPNPAGRTVEGTMPVVDRDVWTPMVAHRHGLTLGELCHLYHNEIGAAYPLHIISAQAGATGRLTLPWTIPPASDIPGLFTCQLYSGGALWKDTTVTPGLGTPRPYEFIGAPFLNPSADTALPAPEGVQMRPCSFVPAYGMYEGEVCRGWQILLLPGVEYHSLLHTLQLMRHISERYSEFSYSESFFARLADPVIAAFLRREITFDIVQEHVKLEEQKWIRKAKRFVLYEDAPRRIK
jgi:uncharacterized protein YbbC (DUF1343 family)